MLQYLNNSVMSDSWRISLQKKLSHCFYSVTDYTNCSEFVIMSVNRSCDRACTVFFVTDIKPFVAFS